jgi:hypothetical protein
MLQTIGRFCYGMAAVVGLIAAGTHLQTEQTRQRGLFAKPPTQNGLYLALWAPTLLIVGKVLEDLGKGQPVLFGSGSQGKFTTAHAQALHSAFDLGDQINDQLGERRSMISPRP